LSAAHYDAAAADDDDDDDDVVTLTSVPTYASDFLQSHVHDHDYDYDYDSWVRLHYKIEVQLRYGQHSS